MKTEQAPNSIASWLREDSALGQAENQRIRRLQRAITVASQGRVVAAHGEFSDRTAAIRDLSVAWADEAARKSLDAYARSQGMATFAELTGSLGDDGSQALIGHLEDALRFTRSSNRRNGVQPRDKLIGEVLQYQSLEHTLQMAFERTTRSASIKLIIDAAYRDYILNIIENAKSSIWVAVSNITDPSNARHPMTAVFDALEGSRGRNVSLHFFVPTDTNFDDGAGNSNGDKILRRALALQARVITFHPSLPYHAKVIIVDDEILIVGSHGLTGESLLKPGDVSVEVQDKQLAGEAQRWLLSLAWKSGSRIVA